MISFVSRLPIRIKIFASSVLVLVLICFFIFLYYPVQQRKQAYLWYERKDHSLAEMIVLGIGMAWESDNREAITEALSIAQQDSTVLYVVLLGRDGQTVASYNPHNLNLDISSLVKINGLNRSYGRAINSMVLPIRYRGADYGVLLMGTSLDGLYNAMRNTQLAAFYVSLAIFLLGFVVSMVLSGMITRPISAFRKAAGEIAKGNHDVRVDVGTDDEIGLLARAFNRMAANVSRAMKELRQQAAYSRNNPAAVLRVDSTGRIVEANGAAVKAFGTDPVGKSLRELLPGLEENRWTDITADSPLQVEHEVGEKKMLFVVKKDVSTGSLYVYGNDITESKALEEQLRQSQKMEAIGELAGGVAHDFNNILSIIKGYCELSLRNIDARNPLFHNIEQIKKAGERAASLTNQLLAFSRRQIIDPKVLNLNTVVAETLQMLRRLIGENIELATNLADKPCHIRADRGQTEQVIMNLAVNARDAMPNGGRLTIETSQVHVDQEYARMRTGLKPGPYVVLTITDTGYGMNSETKDHIFEPFFTTKQTGKGTGLGLSTVYGIVKQGGGHVSVYSEPGKGSVFKIYWPKVTAELDKPTTAIVTGEIAGGKETILLVEDEKELRTVIRQILEMYGYSVLEAGDGESALELADSYEGRIDMMLTDVVMPGMGGQEVAERLAQSRPEMKVLYASGYTDTAIVQHGILHQGTAFIQKPFSAKGLASKIREVLCPKEVSTVQS